MAPSNYPGALDSLPRPGPLTEMDDAGFEGDVVIDNISDAIEAIEAKLGIGGAAPPASAAVLRRTATGASGWGQVQGADIAGAQITNGHLVGNTITNGAIALNTILSANIQDGTIATADLAAQATFSAQQVAATGLPVSVTATALPNHIPGLSITVTPASTNSIFYIWALLRFSHNTAGQLNGFFLDRNAGTSVYEFGYWNQPTANGLLTFTGSTLLSGLGAGAQTFKMDAFIGDASGGKVMTIATAFLGMIEFKV